MSSASVTITRPSNTTAYTAGDVIGQADTATPANAGSAALAFKGLGNRKNLLIIVSTLLRIDLISVPSGMTNFRLHLYKSLPDAILDNAAWAKTSTNDKGAYAGYIDLGSPAVVGGDLIVRADGINMAVQMASDNSDLYGVLVTNGGYTPASGTVAEVTLYAIEG